MPPKKSKSVQRGSSTQPLPDPAKPTRASGRKRRHSDTSDAFEAPSVFESGTHKGGPSKRRKQSKAAVKPDAEVIFEEEAIFPQANGAGEDFDIECGGRTETNRLVHDDEVDIALRSPKQVRFDPELPVEQGSTATNITPHPRKMAVKRRVTLSPAEGEVKRFQTTLARRSLPPSLSQLSEDEVPARSNVVHELQFAPLRSVLDERIRRRLRRSGLSERQNSLEDRDKRDMRALEELEAKEAKLRDLALELETQRQFAMDVSDETNSEHDKLKALEVELAALKSELTDLHATHAQSSTDHETLDHDMLVLDTHSEVTTDQLPTPEPSQPPTTGACIRPGAETELIEPSSPFGNPSRASIGVTATWEAERRRFEDAIVALSREANDAKAELQILHIELEALGFADHGSTPLAVLESIRNTFAQVREDLDIAIPGTISAGASNEDIVKVLVANVKTLTDQLRHEHLEIQEQGGLVSNLSQQVQGLLNHLADAEIRKKTLQQQWRELDEANEVKAREMEDLEEELDATQCERVELQDQLDTRVQEVESLNEENSTMVKNLEKLAVSLESYRKEEARLSDLITKMEEEHRECIQKMSYEREQTVQELDARLDAEISSRTQAEQQVQIHEEKITELDLKIKGLEKERETLSAEQASLEGRIEAEQEGREELGLRIENLELELEKLNGELQQLRQLNEAERQQREAAEAELDRLNEKLHRQGIEANQLRQKLFEAQQTSEARIKELQQSMSERDDQYQNDFAEEVRRREELEVQLNEVEAGLRADLAAREQQIAALGVTLEQREEEIKRLGSAVQRTESDSVVAADQHEKRTQQLLSSIVALENTISLHEESIATLGSDKAGLETIVSDLQAERVGLERRVEQEAEQMLQLQNEKQDEIEALKSSIHDKQQKILIVEEKALNADRNWQEVLDSRDQEIAGLQATSREAAETNATLQYENATLKKRFQEYIRQSSGIIERFQATVLTAKTVIDEEGDIFKGESHTVLEELELMDEIVVSSTRQAKNKTSSGRGRKRQQDSGIGMDEEEEEENSLVAAT